MATSEIIEKILNKAREKGEAELKEARVKYEQILKDKVKELENDFREQLESGKKHIREKHLQRISALRLTEKNKLQALKRKLLNNLYDIAWKRAVSGKYYLNYLDKELKNNASPGDTIIVSAKEKDSFEKSFKEILSEYRVSIAEEKGKFRAGFIIPKGDIRLNCSLDEAFKTLKEENEVELAKTLFKE